MLSLTFSGLCQSYYWRTWTCTFHLQAFPFSFPHSCIFAVVQMTFASPFSTPLPHTEMFYIFNTCWEAKHFSSRGRMPFIVNAGSYSERQCCWLPAPLNIVIEWKWLMSTRATLELVESSSYPQTAKLLSHLSSPQMPWGLLQLLLLILLPLWPWTTGLGISIVYCFLFFFISTLFPFSSPSFSCLLPPDVGQQSLARYGQY